MSEIKGLHHITSMASDANANNRFFTRTLGMRRVKKTVNFDRPEVYHLYYGDEIGTPGALTTYFPFGGMPRGKRGANEVSQTEFAVPRHALGFWQTHLADAGIANLASETKFGEARLAFDGPDGERLVLVEDDVSGRSAWTGAGFPDDVGILGLHGARLRVSESQAMEEVLSHMGYRIAAQDGAVTRYRIEGGNAANTIDVEVASKADPAKQGAGSVHHIAFAVETRAAQDHIRQKLCQAGYLVTEVKDRDYFWAIYFQTPSGILFEIATNEPGFDRDEDRSQLGEALQLPIRHEAKRCHLAKQLPVLDD